MATRNCRIGQLGATRHREFAFAAGEMTRAEFTRFLTETLANAAAVAKDGAIAYVCMDWRHMRELLDAGDQVFSEQKNLCVWNKANGGMGTFYRSKHELIFVYKVGTAPHTNSFGLGETGRYRTNVWDYAGISSLGADRSAELAMHPTVAKLGRTSAAADLVLSANQKILCRLLGHLIGHFLGQILGHLAAPALPLSTRFDPDRSWPFELREPHRTEIGSCSTPARLLMPEHGSPLPDAQPQPSPPRIQCLIHASEQ
jgi:hypothetical protein